MMGEGLNNQASQSILSRQVQTPASLGALTPCWNTPYPFHQLPRAYLAQWRAPKKSLLDPLQQVMGDEHQPQKGMDGLKAARAQIAQSIYCPARLEKCLDALS